MPARTPLRAVAFRIASVPGPGTSWNTSTAAMKLV
jgi:hypothetical protein